MSFLTVAISQYFKDPSHVVRDVEERADLPRMTIGNILKGTHPRADRFGQLLRAVDDETAIAWLEAYLLDDVPEDWRDRVRFHIKELQSANVLREYAATMMVNDFDVAWQRLRAVISRDAELGLWFVRTVALVLGEPAPTNLVTVEAKTLAKGKTSRSGHPQDNSRLDPMPSQHVAQEHEEP